jgi:hypothetical protein
MRSGHVGIVSGSMSRALTRFGIKICYHRGTFRVRECGELTYNSILGHESSNTQRLKRILTSGGDAQGALSQDILSALDKAELLLNLGTSPVTTQPVGESEVTVNSPPRKNQGIESSTSPITTTAFSSTEGHHSRLSSRPTLFAEAGYRRWGAQSAVGVACKGVLDLPPRNLFTL